MSTDTLTAAGTEFYIEDLAEVILHSMFYKADEVAADTVRLTITEKDLHEAGLDYARNNPEDLFGGSAFDRLGYGYEEDRSVGYASVYDVPKELAGDYELLVDWTPEGEEFRSVTKIK